ncbi:MAG: hypothetical protein AAF928_10100 [Myxococcota bacterium]
MGLFVAAAMPSSGCSSDNESDDDDGGGCDGGVVVDGECRAKCDPAKCVENNVCVDNQCKLLCTAHDQCVPGFQVCQEALTDEVDGVSRRVNVCEDSRLTPIRDAETGFPFGWWGQECPFGDSQCELQTACPDGTPCTLAPPAGCTCERDDAACGDAAKCNRGKCAGSDQECIFNTCDVAECTPLECVDFRSEGDADAYCSKRGCATDDDCAAGFYCGLERDVRPACGDEPDNFCGTPDAPGDCVDLTDPRFQAGTRCAMQGVCLQRDPCAPCATNLDCSLADADVCAAHLGDDVCARFCVDDSNCAADEACVPYAPAAAKANGSNATCGFSPTIDCIDPALDCPVAGDTCVPRNVCVPESGKCDSSDITGDKFCAHCTDDTDCGPPGSAWICLEDDNGDNVCLDTAFPVTCSTNADCPTSPSGLQGYCVRPGDPFGPGLEDSCWFPERQSPFDGYGCYPR